jgi:hypothetical protein
MYIVEIPGGWFLRNSVATGDRSRATVYQNETDALIAIMHAKKYLPRKSVVKTWRIVPHNHDKGD